MSGSAASRSSATCASAFGISPAICAWRASSVSNDAGESEDTIETPYNYDPLVVGFNSQYLIDFLKAIGTQGEVRLEFKDAQSAGRCGRRMGMRMFGIGIF